MRQRNKGLLPGEKESTVFRSFKSFDLKVRRGLPVSQSWTSCVSVMDFLCLHHRLPVSPLSHGLRATLQTLCVPVPSAAAAETDPPVHHTHHCHLGGQGHAHWSWIGPCQVTRLTLSVPGWLCCLDANAAIYRHSVLTVGWWSSRLGSFLLLGAAPCQPVVSPSGSRHKVINLFINSVSLLILPSPLPPLFSLLTSLKYQLCTYISVCLKEE